MMSVEGTTQGVGECVTRHGMGSGEGATPREMGTGEAVLDGALLYSDTTPHG